MLFLSDVWLRVYAISTTQVLDLKYPRFTGVMRKFHGVGLKKAFLTSINCRFRWFPRGVVWGPAKVDSLVLMVRLSQLACLNHEAAGPL